MPRSPRVPLAISTILGSWLAVIAPGRAFSAVLPGTWLGGGPPGGTIRALAVDPSTPSVLYAGTPAGLFTSVDGGAGWTRDPGYLGAHSTLALTVLPSGMVYAGAGDGLYRSAGPGAFWFKVGGGLPSSGVAEAIVADATGTTLYVIYSSHVFRSGDGGATWQAAAGLPGVRSLAVDPGHPSTVYAATGPFVYRSQNGGASWASVNTGAGVLFPGDITDLAVDPLAPATVYALTVATRAPPPPLPPSRASELLRSTDGGVTWAPVAQPNSSEISFVLPHPSAPGTVFLGAADGVRKTVDGGTTWTTAAAGSVLAMAMAPSAPNTLYAGTQLHGVLKSEDAALSWTSRTLGINLSDVKTVVVDPTDGQVVYALVSGVGVFKTLDGGTTWTNTLPVTRFANTLVIDPEHPWIVYATFAELGRSASFFGSLFRTMDGGATWRQLTLPSPLNFFTVTVDSSADGALYAFFGGSQVHRSVDHGDTWTPGPMVPDSASKLLVVDPVIPGTWYLTGSPSNGPPVIFKSVDFGASWTSAVVDGGSGFVVALRIDPVTTSTLYIALRDGLFKSLDGGATWSPSGSGLPTLPQPNAQPTDLAIAPLAPSTLFLGTVGAGVYRSLDGGAQWAPFSNGLSSLSIRNLAVARTLDPIPYAATGGASVFKLVAGGLGGDGDARADFAVFRASTAEWFILPSADSQILGTRLGPPSAGDEPIPADYDGDGRRDIATYSSSLGIWSILRSSTGVIGRTRFGSPDLGDVPVPADYDGDRHADLAVYRTTTGQWFIFGSQAGFHGPIQFGSPSFDDIAMPADYDGDGRSDIAVYRRSTGQWFIFGSRMGFSGPHRFGSPDLDDVPVPSDYDGDGATDLAVYRRSTGQWFVFQSRDGFIGPRAFGSPDLGDLPVPADYDGDGRTHLAVFRTTTGRWWVFRSSSGTVSSVAFGARELDRPVPF